VYTTHTTIEVMLIEKLKGWTIKKKLSLILYVFFSLAIDSCYDEAKVNFLLLDMTTGMIGCYTLHAICYTNNVQLFQLQRLLVQYNNKNKK
jgi:hypothetical protein